AGAAGAPASRQVDAARAQRLLPGDHVLIHRVDESAVQVEQPRGLRDLDIETALHGHGFPFPPAASSRPRSRAASSSENIAARTPWFSISRIAPKGGAG